MRNLSFRGLGIAPFYSAEDTSIFEHLRYASKRVSAAAGLLEREQLSKLGICLNKQLPCHSSKTFFFVSILGILV